MIKKFASYLIFFPLIFIVQLLGAIYHEDVSMATLLSFSIKWSLVIILCLSLVELLYSLIYYALFASEGRKFKILNTFIPPMVLVCVSFLIYTLVPGVELFPILILDSCILIGSGIRYRILQ